MRQLNFRLPSSMAPKLRTSVARAVVIHAAAPPVRSEPRLISCWEMNHEHRRAATAVKKSAAPDVAGGTSHEDLRCRSWHQWRLGDHCGRRDCPGTSGLR